MKDFEKKLKWVIDEKTGCWNVVSHIKGKGRKHCRMLIEGKRMSISKLMYEKYCGKIPDGMFAKQRCGNSLCVNPDHLELIDSRVGKPIRYKVDPKTGCHVCISHITPENGYPHVTRNSKAESIVRYLYQQKNGKIPGEKQILHSCDNRKCINLDHVRLGTIKDNMDDKVKRNRQHKGIQINTNVLTEEQVIEILKDSKSLHTELADKYGVTAQEIFRIRKRFVWKHIPLPEGYVPYIVPIRAKARKGEQHGMCKLTDMQIQEIRDNVKDNQYELADKYGISQAHIWRIKHNVSRILQEA